MWTFLRVSVSLIRADVCGGSWLVPRIMHPCEPGNEICCRDASTSAKKALLLWEALGCQIQVTVGRHPTTPPPPPKKKPWKCRRQQESSRHARNSKSK